MALDTIWRSVTDTPASPSAAPAEASATPAASAAAVVPVIAAAQAATGRWIAAGAVLLTALATAALVLAWNTQQRVKTLDAELVKRQQDSGSQATEARTLARQAESTARESSARLALLEARVAETSMQRSQLEELIQSLARSRDENVLADLDAAIRVALQQAAITGSAEPLVLTLKQADERLARYNQPRLERVRRAVAQDLDRTRNAGVTDVTVLTLRLDEAIRMIDDLPLLAAPERRPAGRSGSAEVQPPAAPASGAWHDGWGMHWNDGLARVWQEVRTLVRVTRIDQPEAMLVAPDQAYFLRENVKLRLLNARLALLSRQFDTAQSDLRDAQAALDRYFDRSARRVVAANELVRQVTAQARLVTAPRPDATLAAIATASAGR
jgi:uroporphyrin-3 C-methyltransferase